MTSHTVIIIQWPVLLKTRGENASVVQSLMEHNYVRNCTKIVVALITQATQ